MSDQMWDDPDLPQEDFGFRVGTSFLSEFAAAHSPADVLRELVQNEYDAGGASLDVEFGPDGLTITGNGPPIDPAGWKRLSLMWGTGVVPGESEQIRAKVNGIGSKNFGLRSLFRFGDRISIHSAGRYTVLDRRIGALLQPRVDETGADREGVVVRVRYRLVGDGLLRAFTESQEREAIANIALELAPTLIKLATPGSAKSVRSVTVRSRRLDHEIIWHQTVRQVQAHGRTVKRNVRIEQRGKVLDGVPKSIDEIEYGRIVRPPVEQRGRDFPSYFRAGGGRIRLGVSFPTIRGRLDRSAVGIYYYPLGATRSRTGFPFSVSAPFDMNEDRSQVVDTVNSDRNAWLIEEVSRFVIDLLESELFAKFGKLAYLGIVPAPGGAGTVGKLMELIDARLRTDPCWPSRAKRGRNSRPVFAPLRRLTVAPNAALALFVEQSLSDEEVLHPDLVSDAECRSLAADLGAPLFTLGSLVRLRCAGEDASALATKLKQTEASRRFTDFPAGLRDLELQLQFARALEASRTQLSDHNRNDLRSSPTTLTAAGTLQAPQKPLWVVDEAITSVMPTEALHPRLSEFKVLANICKRFNASTWAADTAMRLAKGDGTEADGEALLRYIRGHTTLSERAWAAIRRAPIFLDHRGVLVAPKNAVLRSTPGARYLEPALRFLTPGDEANRALDNLRLRKALVGDDLVGLARLVESGTVAPSVMRDALSSLPKLLTPRVVGRLSDVRFLETSSESIVAPAKAYVRTDKIVSALGEEAPYAVELAFRLLLRLGCRTSPTFDDIVAGLRTRRESGAVPTNLELVYRALQEAARAEKRPASEHRHEPILWSGAGWVAPDDCLVGSDYRAVFLDSVTVLSGPMRDTYVALGAHRKPDSVHWRRLFEWAGAQHGGAARVPQRVAQALLKAYIQLDGLPDGLSPATPCLLDDRGRLHTPKEAARAGFLINDDPILAKAVRASGATLCFAEPSEPRVLRFLRAAGVQPLSSVARLAGITLGDELAPQQAFHLDEVVSRLHEPHFASALSALSSAISGPDKTRSALRLAARLRKLEKIAFVSEVRRQYRVARTVVHVRADYDVQDDTIVLSRVGSQHEFRMSLARAIAVIADPTIRGEQLADPIYFLLRCRSTDDMRRELERRKIAWQPDPKLAWSDETDEDDEEEATSALVDAVGQAVMQGVFASHQHAGSTPSAPAAPTPRTRRGPLPDLALVIARRAKGSGGSPKSPAGGSGSRGASTNWTPRTEDEREDDRELGRRGEEIILGQERERVVSLGFPVDRVVWTADRQPAADHDIKSVDADGEDLWIEVKATTGREGRFNWPRAEFTLAVEKRERYLLCRVYEAHTVAPAVVDIRDPVGRFLAGELRLELDVLVADIGALDDS